MRSLVASHVSLMALTATATRSARMHICEKLGMSDPVIISQSPDKPSIKYVVHKKEASISELMVPIADELKEKRTDMIRVIIFMKKYEQCGEAFMYFWKHLREELTEPVSPPNDLSRLRMVDMFTACTRQEVKNNIIVQSFCRPHDTLRIVITTIAFGMGLECGDVHKVAHIGSSYDMKDYLQETGCAGRDGNYSIAVLYYSKSEFASVKDSSMRKYCENIDQCRRMLPLREFGCNDTSTSHAFMHSCQCCDICELSCSCDMYTC